MRATAKETTIGGGSSTTRSSYADSANAEPPEGRRLPDTGNIQNIFLLFRGIDPDADGPTSAPTAQPLARDFNYRSCAGVDKSLLEGVANVHFVYDVEITDELNDEEERVILNALERAMMDSVFDSACRRRLGSSRRRLDIHSISSSNRDKLRDKCAVTSDEATVCNRYDGSVKVGYTAVGEIHTELQAGSIALRVVARDMSDNSYLGPMNLALKSFIPTTTRAFDGNSTIVTQVSYVGTSFYNVENVVENEPQISGLQYQNLAVDEGGAGLTTLGKVFAPITALLFLGMLAAMYLSYRDHKRVRDVHKRALLRASKDAEYLRRKQDDMNQLDEYRNELALQSITQDVHRCNKTDCIACTQQLPLVIDGILSQTTIEDYLEKETVEIVDQQGQSLDSGISGIPGERRTPEILVQEKAGDERSMESLFEDEPRSVTFIRVDDDSYSEGGRVWWVKHKSVDHTGSVRNQLEL